MSLIKLSEGNCKSCYKCVKSCDVKAIKMVNEQAEVAEDRCINCGHCVVVCPQEARTIENHVQLIKNAMKNNKKILASIAPSFMGAFEVEQYGSVVSGLKKLGFDIVEETAIGAEVVSKLYNNCLKSWKYENFITTSCPSVNNLIEKYYPSLVKYLAPIVSPMIAHGTLLKEKYGEESFTVFIGPCVSKQAEASEEEVFGAIDAVLTFGELENWFLEEGIELNELEPQEFDKQVSKRGSSFPLLGGIADTLRVNDEDYEIIKVDGTSECMKLFESLKNGELKRVCIEANACIGGCIGGPSMVKSKYSYYESLKRVKEYIRTKQFYVYEEQIEIPTNLHFERIFKDRSIKRKIASEEEINEILKQMGKHEKSDELNCGGCGYSTCREKAQAVFEGMSEAKNCLPYMRSEAERLTNVIFEYSPNIILIVDKNLNIKEINPAGEEAFKVNAEIVKNKPVSEIMDDQEFAQAVKLQKNLLVNKKISRYGEFILMDSIMYLHKYGMVLAIMRNITEQENRKKELQDVKQNTLDSAQEVIEKQMRVAQEIASLLGETTAETKVILTKLKKVAMKEIGDI